MAGFTTATVSPAATYRSPSGPLVSTPWPPMETPPMAGTSNEEVRASVRAS